MPALFYKSFWETIGEDITREVRSFLSGGPMPESWNHTVVVFRTRKAQRSSSDQSLQCCV